MGSFLSKCCGTKKRKKSKANGAKHGQPDQKDDSGKIVLNNGDALHPQDVDLEVPTEDTRKPADVKLPETEKKSEPATSKKKRKQKAATSSSDDSSGWSSSSDSSTNYSKQSTKSYKNKSGGTTIVSKSIKVKGGITKISNVENVTLTINHGVPAPAPAPAPVKKQRKPSPKPDPQPEPKDKEGPCKERFTSYHTPTSLKQEIQSLKTDPISDPAGFFTAQHTGIEDAHTMSTILSMRGSVCKVVYPGGFSTGFRVGINKLMVTLHTKRQMLGEYSNIPRRHRHAVSQFAPLEREGVYAVFNHDSSNSHPVKFSFLPKVHFIDNETDIAILELKPNDLYEMPKPFKYISFPKTEFVFIGHCNGEVKKVESVKKVIHINDVTKREIVELRRWSLDRFSRPYDDQEYADSTSVHRHLFKSKMENGCSGSPGLVVVDGKHVAVVTIYLHKFPDWLFDPDVPQTEKSRVPDSYCISQGVNMYSLYTKLFLYDENLCNEIFKPW